MTSCNLHQCYNLQHTLMETSTPPRVRDFLITAILLAGGGWAGLALLIYYTLPTIGPRWLFFFLSVLALTGTVLPALAFLNRRFAGKPPATHGAILRQAIWFGVYFPTLAWLQIGRVLTMTLAVLLAVGFIMVEWLLRLRERSRWTPKSEETPHNG